MNRALLFLVSSIFLVSCVSSQQVTDDAPPDPEKWESSERTTTDVWNMRLSQTWGEVGKPFRSELKLVDNIRKQREYHVSKLPPGLHFDSSSGRISGVPKQSGFYHVSVAVRPRVEDRPFRYVQPEDRWFSEDFELRIYNQIVD